MTVAEGAALRRRLESLYRFERSGMRPGLAGIERLLEAAGRPDRSFRSVLIAGTNGKGSTAAHLDSILRHGGWRTGLYSSPHLVRFNERIRVLGRELSDEALESLLEAWWERFEAQRPSFFEAATALAFDHFAASNLDVAVVEVGIGGRLDATNIVEPALTMITTISFDHAEILGGTIAEIAAEKAGVARPGVPLLCGVRGGAARDAIRNAAAARGAEVSGLGGAVRYSLRRVSELGTEFHLRTPSYSGIVVTPLLGAHQARNAALAAYAAEHLFAGRPKAEIGAAIERGIAATRWPARAEIVRRDPPVLVDVAHNEEGAAALAQTVAALFPGRPVATVVALSRDKAHARFLSRLSPVTTRFHLTQFSGERAMPAADLKAAVPSPFPECRVDPVIADALEGAVEWARASGGAVVVTGSFFLLNEALPHLGARVPVAL